jgi:hypothetical protein
VNLDALRDVVAPEQTGDRLAGVQLRIARTQRRRTAAIAGGAAASVAAIVVAIITTYPGGATSRPPVAGLTESPSPSVAPSWRALPAPPAGITRLGAYGFWTGSGFLDGQAAAAGGESIGRSIAEYLPSQDRWMGLAPFPGAARPEQASAFVRGHLLVAGGGPTGDELWDLTLGTGTWTRAAALPVPSVPAHLVPTDNGVLAVFVSEGGPTTVGVYDLDHDSWQVIDTRRGLPDAAAAVWTGTELLLWGGIDAKGDAKATGIAVNPGTGQVTDLPTAPIQARSVPTGTWTGKEAVFLGGLHDARTPAVGAAAFDPTTRTWRTIADAPIPLARTTPAVWTGRQVVISCEARVAAWDPSTDRWTELPSPGPDVSFDHLTWTGTALLLSGTQRAANVSLDAEVFSLAVTP